MYSSIGNNGSHLLVLLLFLVAPQSQGGTGIAALPACVGLPSTVNPGTSVDIGPYAAGSHCRVPDGGVTIDGETTVLKVSGETTDGTLATIDGCQSGNCECPYGEPEWKPDSNAFELPWCEHASRLFVVKGGAALELSWVRLKRGYVMDACGDCNPCATKGNGGSLVYVQGIDKLMDHPDKTGTTRLKIEWSVLEGGKACNGGALLIEQGSPEVNIYEVDFKDNLAKAGGAIRMGTWIILKEMLYNCTSWKLDVDD